MFWKKRNREPEARHETTISFVGEQDGAPERELKSGLRAAFLEEPFVRAAYLAQIEAGETGARSVALCLDATDSPDLVARIGEIFGSMFAGATPLDILFLTPEREAEIKQVCTAFYRAA